VEAYDRQSYQSIVGAVFIIPSKAGSGLGMETRVRAGWLHEFNDDEEKVNYTLVGSTQPGQFVMRSPDQDVAQFGIGCAAKLKHGMQLQVDLDSQIGETAVFTALSAGLLCEF
jgi:outer membrane autotransporter protein